MERPAAPPGTIVVFSDIACPWASLALHRLRRERAAAGSGVTITHRAFPLELINRRGTPWQVLSAEVPVVAGLEPEMGWRPWSAGLSTWPVTTLPALEAVAAAAEQSPAAADGLDAALRRALFVESRCISLLSVIREVAGTVPEVDTDRLFDALESGRARAPMLAAWRRAGKAVKGSPHLFLPDGTDLHNPGIRMHWEGEPGDGFPFVEEDRPSVHADLIRRAAASVRAA